MHSHTPTNAEITAALDEFDAWTDDLPLKSKGNPADSYVDDIAAVLEPRPWPGMIRLKVIEEVYRRRNARHCNMPKKFEQTVQGAFNAENDQSQAKDRHNGSLLFTSHLIDGQTYWTMRAYRPGGSYRR